MGKKHEDIQHERMFYCFVDLGKSVSDVQKVFVVPSAKVAEIVRESHATWLSKPGLAGRVRKDSNMRRFLPDYSKLLGDESKFGRGWLETYKEGWNLLKDSK